jgi:hypothetical protein
MAEEETIWHVTIDGKARGPLTKAQVLEYLRRGVLAGSDQIWRPGFSDWSPISEIGDFWQPPKRTTRPSVQLRAQGPSAPEHLHDPDGPDAQAAGEKWSVWKSANIGLLVSAFTLLLQIGTGRGFELANYAHTASAATLADLVGQIFAAPLIFVLITVVRNLLKWRQVKSSASAIRGALLFSALIASILGALMVYGDVVFSSTKTISGEARTAFIADMQRTCIQRQRSLGQNVSEAQIETYCACTSDKIASDTTYKQLGTELDANGLAALRQKADAAGNACR